MALHSVPDSYRLQGEVLFLIARPAAEDKFRESGFQRR
jgi:hypothetical protein